MITETCQFSDPITFDGTPPTTKQDVWQFGSTTCTYTGTQNVENVYSPTSTVSTSTDIHLYGGFSAGEMMISLLLLALLLLTLGNYIAQALRHIKTGKRYLQYHGGDVPIRDDL